MNKSLYEEAIADAQKLRELAEETAKNRVVEAVMPQIRDLVNRRILGEQLDDLEDEEDEFSVEIPDDLELGAPPMGLGVPDVGVPEDGSEDVLAPVVNVTAQGDVNIDMDSSEPEDGDEELVLTDTMAEALRRLICGESSEGQRLQMIETTVQKIKKLLESVDRKKLTALQKHRLSLSFNYCLREALKLRSVVILSEHDTQEILEPKLAELIKEMRNMSNRQNVFDFLFEEGKDKEELDEAELSLELEDEEVDDLAAAEDPDAVDAALEDILADVELSLVGGEEEEGEELDEFEPEGEGEGEEALAFGDEDVEEGQVYEIDETTLRRELRRMRRLREQEEGRAAEADPSLAHGGEDLGDVILDIDEDDLLNALADELGDPGVSTPSVPGASVGPGNDATVPESYRRRQRALGRRRSSRRIAETRRQTRRRRGTDQVRQYRKALSGMKHQLVEMNLFNAKLLYANKLMQNKNLSVKQQRAIVEALDNAKTLREAKLLYKSLSGSLSRRARGSKLNEGALRTLGSSSRSTRSAQPAASGVEADRWAVLAGLHGND